MIARYGSVSSHSESGGRSGISSHQISTTSRWRKLYNSRDEATNSPRISRKSSRVHSLPCMPSSRLSQHAVPRIEAGRRYSTTAGCMYGPCSHAIRTLFLFRPRHFRLVREMVLAFSMDAGAASSHNRLFFLTPLRCIDHHLADNPVSSITPSMSVTLTSYPLLSSLHPPHSFSHVPLLIPHHIFSVVACTLFVCPPFFHSAVNPAEGVLERRGLRVHSGGLYGGESRREVALPCMHRQYICPVTNAHDIMALLIVYLPGSVRIPDPSNQLWHMPWAYATNIEVAVSK